MLQLVKIRISRKHDQWLDIIQTFYSFMNEALHFLTTSELSQAGCGE